MQFVFSSRPHSGGVRKAPATLRAGWIDPLMMLAICFALPAYLTASGNYSTRPPQPPAGIVENSRMYELGKAIFSGKATLNDSSSTDARPQRARLSDLQQKLPPSLKKTVDLPGMAGKLSPVQLEALEYFLKVRHKIS
jgi:hypothetical protein